MQVIDPAGSVVSSSTNVAGVPALASLPPGEDARIDGVPLEGGSFLVVAIGAATAEATRSPSSSVAASTTSPRRRARPLSLLVVGVPVLVLVVASVTWWITGRALGPVESIRAEVESISAERPASARAGTRQTGDEVARLAATMNRMLVAARGLAGEAAALRVRRGARVALARRIDQAARRGRDRASQTTPRSAIWPRWCTGRTCGSNAWSTTCCCSPGSTRRPRASRSRSTSTTSCSRRPRACGASTRAHGRDRRHLGRASRGQPDRAGARRAQPRRQRGPARSKHREVHAARRRGIASLLTVDDDGPGIEPDDRATGLRSVRAARRCAIARRRRRRARARHRPCGGRGPRGNGVGR